MNRRLTVTAAAATVLASVALYPLISNTRWFFLGMGAAALAAVIGTLTRLRVLPAVICFLAALAGEFLYLNALFAGPESFGQVVPTAASVHHLVWLVGRASAVMAKYAPPVPVSQGITLVTAAGIGLVAAITDLVGVRLRRPAIAGLPLLVLFCVPLTTDARPGGFGAAVVFCLGIMGYLALLSAEGRERVRLWGRLVRPWPGGPASRGPDTRQLTAAGRRIGFAAVVLALLVPLFLPGLKHHRLIPGTGHGRGYTGSLSLPEPLVQLNQQLHAPHPQTVLTYRSNATTTPPYLQVYVLGQLSTSNWSMAPPVTTSALGKGALPAVPGLAGTVPAFPVRETISLGSNLRSGSHEESYLPVPYAPRSVTVPGDWRVDPSSLTVLTADTPLAGLRYTVTSKDVDPSPQQLRRAPPAAAGSGYLAVPPVFRQILPLTKRITAGQSSPYGEAVALQQWFTRPGNFTYTLNVAQPGDANALLAFLTRSKRGYCQQFAFAMAVMARLLGIPSRVVVGYTQGVYRGNDTWAVRTSDAHAWPELYFAGAGWLRFEPTPSGSTRQTGQATASPPAYSYPPLTGAVPAPLPSFAGSQPGGVGPGATPHSGLSAKLRRLAGAGGAAAGQRKAAPLSAGLIILAVLTLMAVTPRAARSLVRRRRWLAAADDAQRAHAAWGEVRDDLADHRIACRASESPRALARRIGAALSLTEVQRAALGRIALAEESALYASSPVASAGLRADVATVRRAVATSSRPGARLAAAVLPASVTTPAWAAVQNALDVFGWMEVITTGLRRGGHGRRAQPAFSWRTENAPSPGRPG